EGHCALTARTEVRILVPEQETNGTANVGRVDRSLEPPKGAQDDRAGLSGPAARDRSGTRPKTRGSVAQPAEAPGREPGCWRFDSSRSHPVRVLKRQRERAVNPSRNASQVRVLSLAHGSLVQLVEAPRSERGCSGFESPES